MAYYARQSVIVIMSGLAILQWGIDIIDLDPWHVYDVHTLGVGVDVRLRSVAASSHVTHPIDLLGTSTTSMSLQASVDERPRGVAASSLVTLPVLLPLSSMPASRHTIMSSRSVRPRRIAVCSSTHSHVFKVGGFVRALQAPGAALP